MSSPIPSTAADVINLLLPDFPSVATITTATTGTPGVAGMNPSLIKSFRSYKYMTDAKELDQEFTSLADIDDSTQNLKFLYDLLFLDSWHTYEDSLRILEIGVRLAKPNSIILVHDCLSLSSSLSADYVPGAWSGVTCFVFREFAKKVNREWFVLDSDYGVGVLGPEISNKKSIFHSINLEDLKKSEAENLEQFYISPRSFMRGISPTDFQTALHLIRSGKSPEYLVGKKEIPQVDNDAIKKRLQELEAELSLIRSSQVDTDGIKKRLQELEAELSLIKNSRIWKATSFYRWLRR